MDVMTFCTVATLPEYFEFDNKIYSIVRYQNCLKKKEGYTHKMYGILTENVYYVFKMSQVLCPFSGICETLHAPGSRLGAVSHLQLSHLMSRPSGVRLQ